MRPRRPRGWMMKMEMTEMVVLVLALARRERR
jgi:hypothetical protein